MKRIEIDKEGCLCCKCRKFMPDDLKENCSANTVMIKLYAKWGITVKTADCPMFEEDDEDN